MIPTITEGDKVVCYKGRAMRVSWGSGEDIIVVAANDEILGDIFKFIFPDRKSKKLWKTVTVTPA